MECQPEAFLRCFIVLSPTPKPGGQPGGGTYVALGLKEVDVSKFRRLQSHARSSPHPQGVNREKTTTSIMLEEQ